MVFVSVSGRRQHAELLYPARASIGGKSDLITKVKANNHTNNICVLQIIMMKSARMYEAGISKWPFKKLMLNRVAIPIYKQPSLCTTSSDVNTISSKLGYSNEDVESVSDGANLGLSAAIRKLLCR